MYGDKANFNLISSMKKFNLENSQIILFNIKCILIFYLRENIL